MTGPSHVKMILASPRQFIVLVYAFTIRLILILASRLLLPPTPRYQSLRIEIQRAFQTSASLHFRTFTHRLPAEYPPSDARPVSGRGFAGYLVPGQKLHSVEDLGNSPKNAKVVLYAHGGGYAIGVARMYVPYMKRWANLAKERGIELVFLSVEYTLSTEAPHPRQRNEFIAAYKHLLEAGVSASQISFMGDSAGGGICTNSALHLPSLSLPQPASTILVSPWLDMEMNAFQGGSHAVMSDYFVQANDAVPGLVKLFIGKDYKPTDPAVNPLYQDVKVIESLNPQLIFVGAAEFALYDSKTWASLCRKAGVKTNLQIEWGQLHIWAMGSKWIEPALRMRTDNRILDWMEGSNMQ
ncbi:uncharacterized protein RCC_12209 [Ramularia collo-cygni]|uniref:Alpha/beta hydrolase fold-3 domain-containing protein n=1 Tax=Ramularia collo-cygni TaxID=112498 RepID=A0A2D3UP98_9PEZI|nr:uncharacterized protein RCC_12209 [Ramularia collo-cygni]CZT14615.1 uncharacterized protein RCC_12209 [Ramularia collo-cygni]